MTKLTRVVLAEDNEIVRNGIRRLLDIAQNIEVIGEARDGVEAISLVRELSPDILLLDVEMPRINGIEVAHQVRVMESQTQVLVLSAYDDLEYILAMLDNGVAGYLIKDEAPYRIIQAILRIAQGQTGWVSPQVEAKLRRTRPDLADNLSKEK